MRKTKTHTKTRESLVTVVTFETYERILTLLERAPFMTPVRWLGLVARERVARHGLRPFDRATVDAAGGVICGSAGRGRRSVRLVASVPLGVAGGHHGLTEARWARALIVWALAEGVVPESRAAVAASLARDVKDRRERRREARVDAVRDALLPRATT